MKTIPVRRMTDAQREPNLTEAFNIRSLSTVLAGKDLVQELHRHDYYHVLALQKGKGNHIIDFVPYTVKDNTIFVMRPGQVHELNLKAGSTGYLVAFQPEFCKTSDQLVKKASRNNCYALTRKEFNALASLFNYILDEYSQKRTGYQHIIKANLNILFVELGRRGNTEHQGSALSHQQERLDKFLELIDSNFSNIKKASAYADLLNISPFQLNAITKSLVGKTSSDVIDDHIILEAKRLLLGTSNQVSEIADQLGYPDVSYFIRFFKKHTGQSPEVFRQNSR